MEPRMIFRQLFDHDTWTYTYLLADSETRDAVIIDPVLERADRDLLLMKELELKLVYTLDTHVHADHVTGSGQIRYRTEARSVASAAANVPCVDHRVLDGSRLRFGNYEIEVRSTPGHTSGCVTYVVIAANRTLVFTGDSLLVRGSGRTDFQKGDPRILYRSVHQKIYTLPDNAIIYPGHDYQGRTSSTVAEEKQYNPRLNTSVTESQYVEIMNNLNLEDPKLMDMAVPANQACGQGMIRDAVKSKSKSSATQTGPDKHLRSGGGED